jgi:hypothetical protein
VHLRSKCTSKTREHEVRSVWDDTFARERTNLFVSNLYEVLKVHKKTWSPVLNRASFLYSSSASDQTESFADANRLYCWTTG